MNGPSRLVLASGLILGFSSLAAAQAVSVGQPVQKAVVDGAPKPTGPTRMDRYAKVLTLDAAQTEAAKALYEAYQRDTSAAAKKTRDAVKEAQGQMDDGDHKGFEQQIAKAMREQGENSKRLTDGFLSDLRSLLTPAQADRWPSLERLRRRELYLGGLAIGGIGGANVDLFTLIDKLKLPADLKPKADALLAQYEVDVDRPLQDRQHHMEDEQKQMGAVQHFDGDSFAKKQERDRTVDMAVREVNARYIRQIGAALPDDWSKKLAEAYDAKAYRSIYKESSVARKLTAAQKLADLSAEQKKGIEDLLARYRKDAKAANDRWAAAQKAAEDAGRPTGAGVMMIGPGSTEKLDPAFVAARGARRDVDTAAREQLEKLLTPEQLASIPDQQPGMGGMGGVSGHRVEVFGDGSGADMVFVGDVDGPDDIEPGMGGGGAPVVIMRTVEIGGGPGQGGQGGQGGPHTQPDQTRPAPKP